MAVDFRIMIRMIMVMGTVGTVSVMFMIMNIGGCAVFVGMNVFVHMFMGMGVGMGVGRSIFMAVLMIVGMGMLVRMHMFVFVLRTFQTKLSFPVGFRPDGST